MRKLSQNLSFLTQKRFKYVNLTCGSFTPVMQVCSEHVRKQTRLSQNHYNVTIATGTNFVLQRVPAEVGVKQFFKIPVA